MHVSRENFFQIFADVFFSVHLAEVLFKNFQHRFWEPVSVFLHFFFSNKKDNELRMSLNERFQDVLHELKMSLNLTMFLVFLKKKKKIKISSGFSWSNKKSFCPTFVPFMQIDDNLTFTLNYWMDQKLQQRNEIDVYAKRITHIFYSFRSIIYTLL